MMDIRNEITNGNLMLAIKELDNYRVPEMELMPLLYKHNDRYELETTGVSNVGVTYYSYDSIREEAFKLLDKYALTPPPKPLHEMKASLLKGHKVGGVQHCHFLLEGRANNDLETDSVETVERMVACWNACKGIPTNEISSHPAPLFKKAQIDVERRKAKAWESLFKESVDIAGSSNRNVRNLAKAIIPIFAEWKRQKNMFPDLHKDVWMDAALGTVMTEIRNLGLGDMLADTYSPVSQSKKPPMQKFYFTLGQMHEHPIVTAPGHIEMWDKDSVLVVSAENWDAARDLVVGKFGDTWSHQYSSLSKEDISQHYPGGFIVPDMQWMAHKIT